MGSRNPQVDTQTDQHDEAVVTTLVNAAYYFLESVIIVVTDDTYRLIVCHHDQVLADESYDTLRGAKIAFSKLFQPRVNIEIKPEWSPMYPPEKEWLDEKLNICLMPFSQENPVVTVPFAARTA